MNPDLASLETFLAVSDAPGFARAARQLGVSQPAVSYRIARLETHLGTKLFEEPRRNVVHTPAGRRLHEFCVRFLSELEALASELAHGHAHGVTLRVVTPGAFGRHVVFPALRHPALRELTIELRFRTLDQIFDLVESGDADIGIAYHTRVTPSLEFRKIAEEEFCLICPAGSCPPPEATIDDIAALPFVTYEECDYVFGRWFGDVFGRSPQRLSTVASFSRIEEVVATVCEGRGASVVPGHAIRSELADGSLAVFRPHGRPRSVNPEYLVFRPGWQPREDVDLLVREIGRLAQPW